MINIKLTITLIAIRIGIMIAIRIGIMIAIRIGTMIVKHKYPDVIKLQQ